MKRKTLVLLSLLFFCITGRVKAEIIPVVEYSSSGILTDVRPFTLGYLFSTSVEFDVNALGYWVDGLGHNHQVGIWNSTGTLLTSTTVLSTDPIVGHFQYHSIPDLILPPGTYTIGGEFLGNGDPFPTDAQGVVSLPGYTWLADEQIIGSGLNFPNVSFGGAYGQNGILAADFSGGPVPEPATLALLGIGVAGIAFYCWRRPKLARA